MFKKVYFEASMQGLGLTLDYIEDKLLSYKMSRKEVNHAIMSVDETLATLISVADKNEKILCQITNIFGKITIKVVIKGEKIDFEKSVTDNQVLDPTMGHEAEEAIRNIILKNLLRDIKYKCVGGYNTLIINVGHEVKSFIYYTLSALFLAILFGLVGRSMTNVQTIENIDKFFLMPVSTMFNRSLGLITAPCIFFAIACAVSDFKNYFEFGKIGYKIIFSYLVTTIIAVFVGAISFMIFKPGVFGLIKTTGEVATNKLSYIDVIVNIIPTTVIEPFVSDSMLQLIFFGILCGSAISMIGDYTQILKQIFDAMNALLGALRSIIVNVFPLAIFCITSHSFLTIGSDTFLSLLQMIFTEIFATFLMIIVYCLIVLFVGKLNPLVFLKKYAPNFIPTLTAASYGITMPDILSTCKNKLGISKKIYSFSVPLGATINLDGNCIYFSIAALFLTRICGVELNIQQIVMMLLSIVILSFGSPGQAGSGIMCLTAILSQVGVSVESVAFIVSIDAFIGLFRKMSNIVGDVVCSLTVASTEGMVDKDIYYKK